MGHVHFRVLATAIRDNVICSLEHRIYIGPLWSRLQEEACRARRLKFEGPQADDRGAENLARRIDTDNLLNGR
jgi:hypothetical protein